MPSSNNKSYSANMTSDSFLYIEMKETARLLLSGLSMDESKTKITEENLFNYSTRKGISRRISVFRRRFQWLDNRFLEILVNGDYKSSTLVALYSIYKEERLFQEFMDTIVMDKLNSIDKIIKPSDMTLFLTNIGSSDGSVANWKDSTRKKLWSVFKRILINSGVIDNKCRIKRQIINPALKDLFIKNGDYKFIKCIF